MTSPADLSRPKDIFRWFGLAVAAVAILVVAWAVFSSWGALTHGHPAYPILLGLTVIVSGLAIWRLWRPRVRQGTWRLVGRIALLTTGVLWVALIGWLRPHDALEPALSAMTSDDAVTVTETSTRIVLASPDSDSAAGVYYQPGALVDARAYAAVLRPVAEAGYTVVIEKQPLNLALLAMGGFDRARDDFPEVTQWVVAGHSLGGTVAAMHAVEPVSGAQAPVVGLIFHASYPASDISEFPAVVSISGSKDGLATPEKIAASQENLTNDAEFLVIEGANHAQFGAYGPQAGDGVATISADEAQTHITAATLSAVQGFTSASP